MNDLEHIGDVAHETLRRAAKAQELREGGAPIVYCETCGEDTVACPDGTCCWCDRPL